MFDKKETNIWPVLSSGMGRGSGGKNEHFSLVGIHVESAKGISLWNFVFWVEKRTVSHVEADTG